MDLDINAISKEYSEKNILVIGDIILDAYIYGKVDRISQEAPVPIVAINNKANNEVSSFLLKHDTVHGRLESKINYDDHSISVNGKKIYMSQLLL